MDPCKYNVDKVTIFLNVIGNNYYLYLDQEKLIIIALYKYICSFGIIFRKDERIYLVLVLYLKFLYKSCLNKINISFGT